MSRKHSQEPRRPSISFPFASGMAVLFVVCEQEFMYKALKGFVRVFIVLSGWMKVVVS
jgi:hypothetical protein